MNMGSDADRNAMRTQRARNFVKAAGLLKEFIEKPNLSGLERLGLIHCFEYTFELARTTMTDYLEDQGFTVKSPRDAIQTAFQIELVKDGHSWIDALDKRNLLAHTYDEGRANEAETLVRSKYYPMILELQKSLSSKL